jgi:phosphate butyryltransferase
MPEPTLDGEGAREKIAPSMWVGALVSGVLGNIMPGPGTLYRSQSFQFLDRVHVGDELTITVEVLEKLGNNLVKFSTRVTGRGSDVIAEGEAQVYAPTQKMRVETSEVPVVEIRTHQHSRRLLDACKGFPPLKTAVVAPEEKAALGGALLAAENGLIAPVFIGSEAAIRQTAAKMRVDLTGIEIRDVPRVEEAAEHAADLAGKREVGAIMKGALHTDQLLHAILRPTFGLTRGRRLSHVFTFDVPGLDHLLMVTDAAINIAPNLEEKVDIVQNAIELAHALGIAKPKVCILSAVETVNPKIPSTLDAAILSKMSERGQIQGAVVDGPLAMDNAVDLEAARTKGITSLVAGRADILVVPNLEAGNMLAKELVFVAHAHGAGLVVGANVPIILTSRADDENTRLASCAIAALYHHASAGTSLSAIGRRPPSCRLLDASTASATRPVALEQPAPRESS